jgi:hypothetical protein
VGVAWTQPAAQAGFVELLIRALGDRGRACRSLPSRNNPGTGDAYAGAHGTTGGPTVAVITSGASDPDDHQQLCRIDVELHAHRQPAARVAPACHGPDRRGTGSEGDIQPDVIVDYLDPAGPTIRHITPGLTPQPDRRHRSTLTI